MPDGVVAVQLSLDPEWFLAFLYATVRCSTWLVFAPPLRSYTPVMVRSGLSMGLGLAMAPRLLDGPEPLKTDIGSILAGTVHNAAIGLILAFAVYLLFQAVASAGAMIDVFSTLSSAQLFDPMQASTSGPVSRLYQILGTMILFATNGHLILLQGVAKSFDVSPVDGIRLDRIGSVLTQDFQTYLVASIQIAAPILIALFLTEILLGLASRAAPKLNILSIGFGAKTLVTFMLMGAALPLVAYFSARLLEASLGSMSAIVSGG
ncbi:MAG: flagellar biosynthetic protein FliR [Actinobacteria bacterium]|nr:flagellar biosynthetic protein FliR [Actinomycetota bacterium]